MTVTIYHNPRCSKSRETLDLLKAKGVDLEIVEYLSAPLSETEIKGLLSKLQMGPRELMRPNEDIFKGLGLHDRGLTDETLIQMIHKHPVLIQRPIVVNGEKAAIGRPPEVVLEIL